MYCACTPAAGYPSTPACCVDHITRVWEGTRLGAKWASVDLIYLSGNLQRPLIVRARYWIYCNTLFLQGVAENSHFHQHQGKVQCSGCRWGERHQYFNVTMAIGAAGFLVCTVWTGRGSGGQCPSHPCPPWSHARGRPVAGAHTPPYILVFLWLLLCVSLYSFV